jgi:formate hydrogenlyase subunit 4
VKLLVLGAVLVRVVAPVETGSPWLDRGVFVLSLFALAVAVGVVESVTARLRLRHVPNLLVAAGVLGGFAFVLVVR